MNIRFGAGQPNEAALESLRALIATERAIEPALKRNTYLDSIVAANRHVARRRDVDELLLGILTALLNVWADEMDRRFDLRLVVPTVQIERLERGVDGMWRRRGSREDIAIDRDHVLRARRCEALATLLHEVLHSWQHQHGGSSKAHDFEYRFKALSLGLRVDCHGHTSCLAGRTPILDLLGAHDVYVPRDLLSTGGAAQESILWLGNRRQLSCIQRGSDLSRILIEILESEASTILGDDSWAQG